MSPPRPLPADPRLRALAALLRLDPAFAPARERAQARLRATWMETHALLAAEDREGLAQALSRDARLGADLQYAEMHYRFCDGCERDPEIDRLALIAARQELFGWLALLRGHPDSDGFLSDNWLAHRHPRLLMLLAQSPPEA